MRKLKLQVQMTVDGFVGGPNGELDWATRDWDDNLKNYVGDITEPVDCIVLGRKLAQGFIPYWASNPEQEGAAKFNTTAKVVFSKTLERSEWSNTTLASGNLVEEIAKLKTKPGGDIIAYGGASFVSSLVREGLIDEFHLFINPIMIGGGLKIFNTLDQSQKLELVKSTKYECGIVILHYKLRQN